MFSIGVKNVIVKGNQKWRKSSYYVLSSLSMITTSIRLYLPVTMIFALVDPSSPFGNHNKSVLTMSKTPISSSWSRMSLSMSMLISSPREVIILQQYSGAKCERESNEKVLEVPDYPKKEMCFRFIGISVSGQLYSHYVYRSCVWIYGGYCQIFNLSVRRTNVLLSELGVKGLLWWDWASKI